MSSEVAFRREIPVTITLPAGSRAMAVAVSLPLVMALYRFVHSEAPPGRYLIVKNSQALLAPTEYPVTNTLPWASTARAFASSTPLPGPAYRFVHDGMPALEYFRVT